MNPSGGVPSVQDLMPSGNFNAVSNDVGALAPMATQWSGPLQLGNNLAPQAPASQFHSGFTGWAERIGIDSAHIIGGIGSWLGHQAVSAEQSIQHFPGDLYNFGVDVYHSHILNNQTQELTQKLQTLNKQWRNGTISSQDYRTALTDWNKSNDQLQKDLGNYSDKLGYDGGALTKSTIGTASAVLAVMTAGLDTPVMTYLGIATGTGGKEAVQGAADYLSGVGARAFLAPTEDAIGKLAVNEGLFKTLAPNLQNAIKDSVQAVLVNSSKDLTAVQMSRAAAANLALKYPIYYNFLSSSGTQLYQDMASGKYGAAAQTLGFNGLLLLSGGPIGWGLKQLGKGASATMVAAGLRPGSVLDALSARIDGGDSRALAQIAQNLIKNGNEEDVKAMVVGIDSTLKRAGGNPTQAVNFIVDHLESRGGEGWLKESSHQDVWNNMTNYWKSAQELDKAAKGGEIEGFSKYDSRMVVPGSWTTADKNVIANISDTNAPNWWQSFKTQNPNVAAANNPNLDRQMTNISKLTDPEARRKAIMALPTQVGLEGVPKDLAARLAARGNVAIIPKTHNVPVMPFEQTSGKLATAADTGDFFTRAAQPLPVLNYVGRALVGAGLSPEMATQRVGDVYSGILAQKLEKSDLNQVFAKRIEAAQAVKGTKTAETGLAGYSKEEVAYMQKQGITPELLDSGNVVAGEKPTAAAKALQVTQGKTEVTSKDVVDWMRGKLKSFADKPTRGGWEVRPGTFVRPPLKDDRQFTTQDIMSIFKVDKSSAKQIQDMIIQAHIDVPREVQGLGNKIIARNFKYNPTAAAYSRVQGAGRFAWNPFFKMKFAYKLEFLGQAETGGKTPVVLGANWFLKRIFPNTFAELDGIATTLKQGIKEGSFGAEAADVYGGELRGLKEQFPKSALRSVAGVIKDMADKAQLSPQEFMRQFPQETADATQALLGYSRTASFLNSPLARTLNFVFFPFRFEVKVSTIMAQALAKTAPMTQVAVIHGMLRAHDFFNSDQGRAWYSENAEVIKLFEYFSPVATLSQIANALGHKPDSVAEFGELGGLPFGWIPTLLDSVGLTHFGQSYVNPKTGAIAQNYVPTNARGAANAAIQDLIGSLFTYPGAEAGLPSKGTVLRNVHLPGTTKSDTNPVTPPISPEQQQFQSVVQGLNGTAPSSNGPAPSPTQPLSVQASLPPQAPTKPIKGSRTTGRKSGYSPALLPGQTSLGQL